MKDNPARIRNASKKQKSTQQESGGESKKRVLTHKYLMRFCIYREQNTRKIFSSKLVRYLNDNNTATTNKTFNRLVSQNSTNDPFVPSCRNNG